MNAAVAYRATLYGLDQPLGLPPRPQRRRNEKRDAETGTATLEAPTRRDAKRQTFLPLDWSDYKRQCAEQGETKAEHIFDVPYEAPQQPHSTREQAWRLFTIYPYRDGVWVAKIILTLGGSLMAIAATLGLLSALRVSRGQQVSTQAVGFDIATAVLLTTDIGLVLLLVAGSLALVCILNASRGAMEPIPIKPGGLEPPKAYKPALLGAKTWVWVPTGADLVALWPKVPFRAAVVNWLGLVTFQVVVIDTVPGILDPTDFRLFQLAVQLPLFIGFAFLLAGNFRLVLWLQEKWYKPKLDKAAWVSAFLASVGSFSLALSPLYQSMGLALSGAIATFVGRWVFLVAILVGFYDLMAFHPNAWAGTSIYGKEK